jgi:hypothetical protein
MTDYERGEPVKIIKHKYLKQIKGKTIPEDHSMLYVDVYDVLKAFDVVCPAMQHAIKKMLCSGQRGVKDSVRDKREAIESINRSIELEL